MKILVVDDEPPARQRLVDLLARLQPDSTVLQASNGVEALNAVAKDAPDVVLMDIRMPAMDGLEAATHLAALASPPAVIFTTAYDSHALAAFDAQAIDYLLKPIRRERLQAALGRVPKLDPGSIDKLQTMRSNARSHLSTSLHGELHLIPISEIRYLCAEDKYVSVGLPDKELPVEDSLQALEAEFPEHFLRVHRNALIALSFVSGLEKGPDGKPLIRLIGVSRTIAVSRRLLPAIRRRLKALTQGTPPSESHVQ